jgi:hypothetical protein
MLRALVLVLALANVVFFAWSHGWLAAVGMPAHGDREPERLQREVRPEALRVQPARDETAR